MGLNELIAEQRKEEREKRTTTSWPSEPERGRGAITSPALRFWQKYMENLARTYLQLPLRQWGACNVVQLKGKVNIAENPIAVMGL